MNLEKVLMTGNEVRVKSDTGAFVTTIDEMTGENSFSIIVPPPAGWVRPHDTLSLSCVTDRGLYMFDARVTDVENSSEVAIAHLRVLGEVRRIQRRQAFRVRESITVNARKLSDGVSPDGKWVKTSTVDIAELGMLLRFNEECHYGQELEMTLRINLFGLDEVIPKVRGRVVRCIPTRNKEFGYLLGIRFEDLPKKARAALIKLVVLSQRNKLAYRNSKRLK